MTPLSKLSCRKCEDDFYIQLVGKPLAEVSDKLNNIRCPYCGQKEHVVLYVGEHLVGDAV